jgi:ElaB/YqjD/DUF883 family membrane-anchored ribosome-binding protein
MNEYTRHESEREFTADESAPERSPEEIERDIERTRERMSSNIDALGNRLSPDNLKNQAKEAITGKAQDVVSNVGDQARQTGSRVIDFITQNPLPVAAVGLGAVWLFSLRNRSEVSGDRMARFAYTGPERREPDGRPGLGRRLADRAEHMKDKVSDVTSRAGELGSGAKERAREAKGGLERMMHENPLAIAVGAAVIGVALGMLLPESDREREMMGPARDRLGDRVQNTAERVKDATVEAGREIKDTVKEEVSYHGPEVKSTLKDAAATVGQQVKESASRVAREAKQEAGRKPPPTGGMG